MGKFRDEKTTELNLTNRGYEDADAIVIAELLKVPRDTVQKPLLLYLQFDFLTYKAEWSSCSPNHNENYSMWLSGPGNQHQYSFRWTKHSRSWIFTATRLEMKALQLWLMPWRYLESPSYWLSTRITDIVTRKPQGGYNIVHLNAQDIFCGYRAPITNDSFMNLGQSYVRNTEDVLQ